MSLRLKIADIINLEKERQQNQICLIASENYASDAVMAAQGSVFTNKYAEGYIGKRYYGGCQFCDLVEEAAIENAKKLFKVGYANVQPHSGSQANQAVFLATLSPGDTILSMGLNAGGHLTHGHPLNQTGKLYNIVHYGLTEEGDINYQEVADLALLHKPKMIIAGFSAFSRIIDWKFFKKVSDEVSAVFLADIAHIAGLIAGEVFPSPVDYADIITTTTHKTLRGPRGGMIMAKEESLLTRKLQTSLFPGIQGGPLMHVIAAKAIAFEEALDPSFKLYQKQIILNARAMAKTFIDRGLKLVSTEVQNHTILIDLNDFPISGKEAQEVLEKNNIISNKNLIANDKRKAHLTSGLRLGTAAITTRGFVEEDSAYLANLIADVLYDTDKDITEEVKILQVSHREEREGLESKSYANQSRNKGQF